jgi:hypothetical protein
MEIIIGKNWIVKTDGLNWVLGNFSIDKKGNNNLSNPTYHPTIDQALLSCYQRRLLGKETAHIVIDLTDKIKGEIAMTRLVNLINKIKAEIITAVGKE